MKPAYYLKHTAPVKSDKYHNMWCWGKFLSLVITGQMMLFVMKIYNHVGTYVYKYIFVFMYFICVCVLGGRGRGLHYQYFWIHFSVSGRMHPKLYHLLKVENYRLENNLTSNSLYGLELKLSDPLTAVATVRRK